MLFQILNDEAAYCDGDGIWYNIYEKMIAWGIVIVIAFLVALFMFRLSIKLKSESVSQMKVFRGYGIFILGYGLSRIIFIFSDIERWNNCTSSLHVQFVLFGYTIGIFSALSLLQVVEGELLGLKKLYVTKFYLGLAIIFAFMAIFVTFFIEYFGILSKLNMGTNIAGAIFLLIIYFRVIKASAGTVRKVALFTFLGVALVLIGSVLDGRDIITFLAIPIWAPPIIPAIGFGIIFYTQLWSQKNV